MLVMNACALPAALFLPVYISGLAAGWLLVRAAGLEPAVNASLRFSPRHRRFIIAGYLVLALLYVLPRSGYLFEGLFGYATDAVCWDDYWHLQELNSLVNALRFPVVSSFQPGAYLSHYYCVWMLPVFLYKILPFGAMTIKVALFLAHLVYALLVLASAGYLAVLVSRTRNQFFWLHYLVLLCSGAGSLLVLLRPLVSHKWWMWDLLR